MLFLGSWPWIFQYNLSNGNSQATTKHQCDTVKSFCQIRLFFSHVTSFNDFLSLKSKSTKYTGSKAIQFLAAAKEKKKNPANISYL